MWREEVRKRALQALRKPAQYGPDLDLEELGLETRAEVSEVGSLEELPREVRRRAEELGVDVSEGEVSGTYFQLDTVVLARRVSEEYRKLGLVVLTLREALEKFEWVRRYLWSAVPVDQDKYTAAVELYGGDLGYFIYVPPGTKVTRPVQTCLFIHREATAQLVHNIIVVGSGAELTLVTICTALPVRALHVGVTEFYLGEGAKLTFTMVHLWSPGTHVRPRTGVVAEKSSYFSNYYAHLGPVASLQTLPVVYAGEGTQVHLTTAVLALSQANIDVGGKIVFRGPRSRGEVLSRAVVRDEASAILRGELVAEAEARGHLDCKSLLLSPKATSTAIPILSSKVSSAELTHEAAIGRISEEELLYLMSKGFTEEEATALIVRGFLETGLEKVPPQVRSHVSSILASITSALATG